MERSGPTWPTLLGIGIAFGAALGALIVLLVRDRRSIAVLGGNGLVNIWNLPNGSTPGPSLGAGAYQGRAVETQTSYDPRASKNETYTLSTDPVRVMSANGSKFWRVQLRNIGPPGSIAFVASDPSVLTFPSMTAQIPAGGFTDMRVAPGGGLFAIGSIASVQLTVTASEEA